MFTNFFKKDYRVLLLIFVISVVWQGLVLKIIYPIHFLPQNLFFSELIQHPFSWPLLINYSFGLADFFLFYLIGKKLFVKSAAFLPPLIFGISPWLAYLLTAGSVYSNLLFFLLLISLGIIILIQSNNSKLGPTLMIIGSVFSCYNSLLMLIVLLFFYIGAISLKLISFNRLKTVIVIIIILLLPLLASMIGNRTGVRNLSTQQIALFADPGLLNSINNFQGQTQDNGLPFLAKLSENKYEYFGKYLLLKTINNLMPQVYFTPQEKLLNFSFTPPIYVGLLMPFLCGLYQVLKQNSLRKYLLLSLVLILPSLFSQKMVDLNRLFLLIPVIIFIITYGLTELWKNGKKHWLVYLIVLLFFLQMMVTIFDLDLRESPRYFKNYCQTSFEIGQQ